jgi:hypothetical protein
MAAYRRWSLSRLREYQRAETGRAILGVSSRIGETADSSEPWVKEVTSLREPVSPVRVVA